MAIVSNITVFVLATTALFHRMEDIQKTWGSVFPHLFFVLGTNNIDYLFVTKRDCSIESSMEKQSIRRKLVAKSYKAGRQKKPEDSLEMYKCQLRDNGLYNILYAGNCTGEYYGIGPTCRCQAAMRFYLKSLHTMFRYSQWFIFHDDDVYLRPFAVQKLLQYVDMKSFPSNESIAVVSVSSNEGFRFSRIPALRNNDNACCSVRFLRCRFPMKFEFGHAQPAFLNRNALQLMSRAVDSNALTRLQNVYGGSHDIILGLLMWMHQIKVFSFHKVYHTWPELNSTELLQISFKQPCLIAMHKATKRKRRPRLNLSSGDWTVGHTEFARKLNDTYKSDTMFSSVVVDTIYRQEECGKRAFDLLVFKQGQKSIQNTKFSRLASSSSNEFSLFLPEHCGA